MANESLDLSNINDNDDFENRDKIESHQSETNGEVSNTSFEKVHEIVSNTENGERI